MARRADDRETVELLDYSIKVEEMRLKELEDRMNEYKTGRPQLSVSDPLNITCRKEHPF